MARTHRLPTPDELEAARAIVREHLAPTPLTRAPELGDDVWLKLETAQPTGAFKVRGALAALSALPAGERAVTPSAGNHGLGMAWAARTLGREATIVVAETASPAKVDALRALEADLVVHGANYDEAEAHALTLDGHFVSGYDDPHVIAGQSTIATELAESEELRPSAPDGAAAPLTIVAPAGGGGLLSGICAGAARQVRVVGVEASRSRALSTAVRAGRVVEVEVADTLADGLAGNIEPGSATIAGVQRAQLTSVSESDLRAAIRALARHHGLVVEGAAAVAYAAVATGAIEALEGPVAIVLTGRNIALAALADVLADTA